MPAMKMLSEKTLRRDIDKTLSTLGYFAITGVIVTSLIMLAMHFRPATERAETLPLDMQSQIQVLPVQSIETSDVRKPEDKPADAIISNEPPVMASMTPISSATSSVGWEIRVNADSWMEVTGVDGKRIENGIVSAGSIKQYNIDQLSSVTIGNADKVQILRNGQAVDFSAFKQDNVARFKIASDGSLTAKAVTP